MSESKEFYGASVDEAADKAAAELGVARDKLFYEVLDSGSGGFMGIGARDARISVETPDLAETPSPVIEETAEAPVATEEPDGPSFQIRDIEDEGAEDDVALETLPPTSATRGDATETVVEDDVPVPVEVLEHVRHFTTSAVEGMGIDGRIDVYDAGEFIAVDVTSEQAGLFIGQKGETIDALQYLLNVATYKGRQFSKRAVLDSEGYRQRRVEAIQGMAHRSARKALRERRRIELPPMNPSERRIVHLYLQDDTRVDTSSEGSGDSRRVTISPL
jgi:spoIIIJ-associated protein